MVEFLGSLILEFERSLFDSLVILVPVFGEFIEIIDQTLLSVDDDSISAEEVIWSVEFLFLHGHTWVMGHERNLRELFSVEQQWEWVLS